MPISDRFTHGWVAGTLGGLMGAIFSFLPYYMGISTLRLSDWSAVLIYGRVPPFSIADVIYSLIVFAGSNGCIGIIFAFLLPLITEKNIYFKGWIIFLVPWWMIYLVTALARTDGTLNLTMLTSLENGISTSIAGLTTVYFYLLLAPKSLMTIAHSSRLAQPVAKRMEIQDYEDKKSDEDKSKG